MYSAGYAQVQGREHLYHYVGRVRKRKYASMSEREKALNRSLIRTIRKEAPELLSPVKSPPKKTEDEDDYVDAALATLCMSGGSNVGG